MLVKFFKGDYQTSKSGKSPAHNGMNYLLNKSRSVEPRLLSGNPEITHALLEENPYAKQYTYGCLSFEESDIPEADKFKHMQEFESVLMSGYSQEQYDLVWIEHRDKGRLELNFHVVNQDLTTGNRLTPFYHKRDIPRLDAWKNITNAEYGYSDPNDPAKARTLQPGNVPEPIRKDKECLDQHITDLVNAGEINNRQQLVDHINSMSGIEVTRQTKKSISIKVDGHKKTIRMKGAIYEQNFAGGSALRAEQTTAVRTYDASRKERLTADKQRLNQLCKNIAEQRISATKATLEKRDRRVEALQNNNRTECAEKTYYQQNSHDDYNNSIANDWNSDRDLHVPSHRTPTPEYLAPMPKNHETEQSYLLQNPVNNPLNPYNNNKADIQNEIITKNSTVSDLNDIKRVIERTNEHIEQQQSAASRFTQRVKQFREFSERVIRSATQLINAVVDKIRDKSEQIDQSIRATAATIDKSRETISSRETGSRELATQLRQTERNISEVPEKLIEAIASREASNSKRSEQTNDLSF